MNSGSLRSEMDDSQRGQFSRVFVRDAVGADAGWREPKE
jgi:hypothetical protein